MVSAGSRRKFVSLVPKYLCPVCSEGVPTRELAASHCQCHVTDRQFRERSSREGCKIQRHVFCHKYQCPTCGEHLPTLEAAAHHCAQETQASENVMMMQQSSECQLPLQPGSRVRLHSLKNSMDLNGLCGTVDEFQSVSGRWRVKLPSGVSKDLKSSNLMVERELKEGDRVQLVGLEKAPHLNGLSGCLVSFNRTSERWRVNLDNGELKDIREQNLISELPEVDLGYSHMSADPGQPAVSESVSYLCPLCKAKLPSFETAAAHCRSTQPRTFEQKHAESGCSRDVQTPQVTESVNYLCPTCQVALPSYEQAVAHCRAKASHAPRYLSFQPPLDKAHLDLKRSVRECEQMFPSEMQVQWWGHLKQLRSAARDNLAKHVRICKGSLKFVSLPDLSCNYDVVVNANRLGSGSFGTVLLMHPRYAPQEEHAVKLIPMSAIERSEAGEQGLRQEISAMMELNHPCIVSIFGLYKCHDVMPGRRDQPEFFCITMPRVCGRPLKDSIETSQPQIALYIARQVADALLYMHEREICHGDIWADNIMVSDAWDVTLIDLGCAKTFGSRKVNEISRRKINLTYAAPEALDGCPLLPPQDCWPVGLVVAEVATGTTVIEIIGDDSEVKPGKRFHLSLIQNLDRLWPGLGRLLDASAEKRMSMRQTKDLLGPETKQYARVADPSMTSASPDRKRRLRPCYAPVRLRSDKAAAATTVKISAGSQSHVTSSSAAMGSVSYGCPTCGHQLPSLQLALAHCQRLPEAYPAESMSSGQDPRQSRRQSLGPSQNMQQSSQKISRRHSFASTKESCSPPKSSCNIYRETNSHTGAAQTVVREEDGSLSSFGEQTVQSLLTNGDREVLTFLGSLSLRGLRGLMHELMQRLSCRADGTSWEYPGSSSATTDDSDSLKRVIFNILQDARSQRILRTGSDDNQGGGHSSNGGGRFDTNLFWQNFESERRKERNKR